MLSKRNNHLVYLALGLATVAAILSTERPGDPYQQVRFLLLTAAPEATAIAGAIAQNTETFVAP
jgi:hypothetical protein